VPSLSSSVKITVSGSRVSIEPNRGSRRSTVSSSVSEALVAPPLTVALQL